MRENNGIIEGLVMMVFPGAMRIFSLIPRLYFFIIAIAAVLIAVILYTFKDKYRSGWVNCIPVAVIALIIGLFSYPKVDSEIRDGITVSTQNTVPEELLAKADAGDVQAQIDVVMALMRANKDADGNGQISLCSDMERMNKYASLAAENESSTGYVLSGIMKMFGIGGPKLKNQALSDFKKAIELDPKNKDAYVNLLRIDSLRITHPEEFSYYYQRIVEIADEEERHIRSVLDSLYVLFQKSDLSKDELSGYLDRYDSVIQPVLSDNREVLVTLLNMLAMRGCEGYIPKYEHHLGNDRFLTPITVLPHIETWNLNRYSKDLDSLLRISAHPMLNAAIDFAEELDLDEYTKASVEKEIAYRDFSEGRLSRKEYDELVAQNKKSVNQAVMSLRPIIGRRGIISELKDSTYSLIFGISIKFKIATDFSASAAHSYTPQLTLLKTP